MLGVQEETESMSRPEKDILDKYLKALSIDTSTAYRFVPAQPLEYRKLKVQMFSASRVVPSLRPHFSSFTI